MRQTSVCCLRLASDVSIGKLKFTVLLLKIVLSPFFVDQQKNSVLQAVVAGFQAVVSVIQGVVSVIQTNV